jgi:hypothetical protein
MAWKVRKKKREQPSGWQEPGVVLAALGLAVVLVYLFWSAPVPLDEGEADGGGTQIHVNKLLELCASENDAFRTLYTKGVVGPGLKQGLAYDENWLVEGAQSGPLPAVALRGVAIRLDRSPVDLGLFLGAEFAINRGNRFEGSLLARFHEIQADKQPRHFLDVEQGLYTGMYADIAHAEPCVSCHSTHPKTPKTDWAMGDVMGATTWTYPKEYVTSQEALEVLHALRASFTATYQSYLDRAVHFEEPPVIGTDWPADCRCLPSAEVFMAKVFEIASPQSISLLTDAVIQGEE